MNPYLLTVFATAVVYIFLLTGILIFGKKELTQLSITDLVFILLISNAVQNAMVNGNLQSLWTGVVAALTLFGLNFLLKILMFKSSFLSKIIEGEPVLLVSDGEVIEENIRKEQITMKELEAVVREHGVEKISEVSSAMLEVDGNISIVSFNSEKKTIVKRKGRKIPARLRRQN
ncbi:MAG TPA: YetF domain-containing protein [Chitinophagales bacterium]|nr:YetF domain-containing protein [Chitinophagales bacterium]